MALPTGGSAVDLSQAAARLDIYDDGWIRVHKAGVRAEVGLGQRWSTSAQYGLDVLSGATPVLVTDTVTTATRFEERRQDVAATASWLPTATERLDVTARASVESDFESKALSLAASTELFDRHATLSIQAALGRHEAWRRGGLQRFASTTASIGASWAHLVNADTELTVLLDGRGAWCAEELGCDANVYRYVPVFDDQGGWLALTERVPAQRHRGAVGLRLRRYLGAGLGAHLSARGALDSWRIAGMTAQATLAHDSFGERLVVRLSGRWTVHSAASFYLPRYETTAALEVPQWRVADRELAGLSGFYAGGSASWDFGAVGPFKSLQARARLTQMWWQYHDYAPMPERQAWMLGGGLDASL